MAKHEQASKRRGISRQRSDASNKRKEGSTPLSPVQPRVVLMDAEVQPEVPFESPGMHGSRAPSSQGDEPAAQSPILAAHISKMHSEEKAGEDEEEEEEGLQHMLSPPGSPKMGRGRSKSDGDRPPRPSPSPSSGLPDSSPNTARESHNAKAKRKEDLGQHPDDHKHDPFGLKNLTKHKPRRGSQDSLVHMHSNLSGTGSDSLDDYGRHLARLVADNLHDAVLVTAGDGVIISTNKAACRLFGYTQEELIGENCTIIMPLVDAKHHIRYMVDFQDRIFSGSAHESKYQGTRVGLLRQMKARKKSGEEFPVELTINPIRDPGDEGSLLIAGYIRDISDRLAAQEAQVVEDKEKQMKQMAEYLLGYVNHEIRNPLQGMQGYIEMVLAQLDEMLKGSTPVTPSQLEALEKDLDSLSHLTTMLSHVANDAMELRELESNNLTISPVPTTINSILDTTAHYMAHKITEKSERVTFKIKRLTTDMPVMLDANRVVQILINFLTNALKYTERGVVVLGAELERDEGELRDDHFDAKVDSDRLGQKKKDKAHKGAGWVGGGSPRRPAALTARFFVKDSGRGIPEERQAHVFQPYQQMFASDARLYGGTGLGLYLCQLITHRMEGEIGFTSKEGHGSEFSVHFPITPVPPEVQQGQRTNAGYVVGRSSLLAKLRKRVNVIARRPVASRGPQFRSKGVRFLVVEDVALNRMILTRMLETFGAAAVAEAGNGKEAMTLLGQDRALGRPEPDVVFMDIVMPEMDGIAATRAMRAFGITAPIVGLTGYVNEQNIAEGMAAGMDKVLAKPCSKDEIANMLADIHMGKWVE